MCSLPQGNSNYSNFQEDGVTPSLNSKPDLSKLNLSYLKYTPQQIERAKNYRRDLALKMKEAFEQN
jgi:hypothetical protein